MKLFSFVPSLFFFIALSILPVTGADNIYTQAGKVQKATAVSFATKAEILSATKSGTVAEMLLKDSNTAAIGNSVVGILQRDYGADTKGLHRNAGFMCGLLLSNVTNYEMKEHDASSAASYEHNHKMLAGENPEKFVRAFDQFTIDYGKAVREYIVAKKGDAENQAAVLVDKQRQIASSEKKEEEERRMKKAVADAQAASQSAADEIKTAAAKEAMAAQATKRDQKLQQCLASDEYKLWQAALKVQQGNQMVVNAQKVLEHDDAVKKESGVTDLAARRAAGEEMVAGKSLVEDAFAVYKQLGGKAATPSEVIPGPDPCQAYR